MSLSAPSTPTTPQVFIQRRLPSEFKVCPLCQALNVKENKACCTCGWKGKFSTESHTVQLRMWEMVNKSDELQILLLKELRQNPWQKLISHFKRLFRKRIDIRA
jgi:hypothetical protein